MFPKFLDNFRQKDLIKDLYLKSVKWSMTGLKIDADNKQIQSSKTGIVVSKGDRLVLNCTKPFKNAHLEAALSKRIAGQIIPPHLLVRLEAKTKSNVFTAEVSSISFTATSARLSDCKITANSKSKKRRVFGIFFEKSKKIPSLSTKREIPGAEYWLDFSGKTLPEGIFYAELDDTFSGTADELAQSMLFSLSFVSGSPLSYRVLTIAENGQETTWLNASSSIDNTEFPEPIDLRRTVYPVVEKTIEHFLLYSLSTGYSAANYLLELCWQLSKTAQISSRVLAVTVAIEGLAQQIKKDDTRPADPEFDDLISSVSKAADDWLDEAATPTQKKARKHSRERVNSLIKRGNEYTGQSLVAYAFEKAGYPILRKERKIWSDGRNATAHGGFNPSNASQEQKMRLEQYFTCTYLLYRLIFAMSQYQGYFTNYSKAGWPEEIFP